MSKFKKELRQKIKELILATHKETKTVERTYTQEEIVEIVNKKLSVDIKQPYVNYIINESKSI